MRRFELTRNSLVIERISVGKRGKLIAGMHDKPLYGRVEYYAQFFNPVPDRKSGE